MAEMKFPGLVAALRDFFDMDSTSLIKDVREFTVEDKKDFAQMLQDEGYAVEVVGS